MANDLKSMLAQQDKGLLIPLVDSHLISEGTKVMSLSKGAIELVKEILDIQGVREQERDDRTAFSASSSANCMREQALNFNPKLKRKEIDAKLVSIFDDGVWRNLKWIIRFYEMGILAQAEVPDYKEKYNLAGTPDAEVDLSPYYGDKYKLVGVEIKGMHNYSFRQFKSGSNQNPLVKKYIMQVHSYMLLKGVDFWVMFCENKDNQEYCERIIERDERIIKYLKKRNKYMIKVRKNSALPAVECGMDESDPQFVKCPQARNCVKSIDKVASMPPLKNRKKYERDARRALA